MRDFFYCSNFFMWGALIWAAFFGWRSVFIFVHKDNYKDRKWDWWFYQVFLNAVGAFVGWVALFYVCNTSIYDFGVGHLIALVISFLGITGNLPYAALIGRVPGLK